MNGERVRTLLRDFRKAARLLKSARRRVLYLRPGDYRKTSPLREELAEIARLRRWLKTLAAEIDRLDGQGFRNRRWAGFVESCAACAGLLKETAGAVDELARLQRDKIRHGPSAEGGTARRTIFAGLVRSEKRLALALRRATRLERLWLPVLEELPEAGGNGAALAVEASVARLAAVRVAMSRVHFELAGSSWKRLLRLPAPLLRRLDLIVIRGLLAEVAALLQDRTDDDSVSSLLDQAERWQRAVEAAERCLEQEASEDLRSPKRWRPDLKATTRFISAYRAAHELATKQGNATAGDRGSTAP